MFCRNCGNALNEGVKFCNKCGTRVLSESAPAEPVVPTEVPDEAAVPVAQEVQEASAPVLEPVPEKPAKKKGSIKKKAILAVVLAGVLLATSTLAALFVPEVGNFMAKTVMPADKYFAHVQKNNAKKLAEDISSMVSVFGAKKYAVTGATADMEMTIGEGLRDALRAEGGADVVETFGWVEKLGMHMEADINGNVYGTSSSVSLNGKNFLDARAVWDMGNGYIYFSLPGVQDEPLKLYTGITLSDADYDKMMDVATRFAEIIPEEKLLSKMITRYVSAIADEVQTASKKGETIKAGDVSERVTRIDVPITEKLMTNVAKAVLLEVKKDNDIRDIIKKVDALSEEIGVSFDADDVWEELIEEIDETLEEIKEADPSGEKMGTLKCWVDAKGEIVGLGFRADAAEMKVFSAEKGDKYGVYMLAEMGGRVYKLDGGGTLSGGKRSGEFNFSVGGSNIVKITLSDVDDAKLTDAGLFSGKLVIEPSDSISGLLGIAGGDAVRYLRGAKLSLTADMVSDYEGSAEIELHLGGKHFVTMKMNAKAKDGAAFVQIPGEYKSEYESDSWLEGMNQEELGKALDNVDAPEEVKRKLVAPPAPTETEETFGTGVALP